MREIKFRGICDEEETTHYGKWIHGYLGYEDCINPIETVGDKDGDIEDYGIYDELTFIKVRKKTIGQFTGLHDKNGVEIYEGDNIILHQFLFDGDEYENQLIGQVIYDDNQACYCLTNIKNEQVQEYMGYKDDYTNFQKETVPINLFYGMHEESFEVIGNIHEEVVK